MDTKQQKRPGPLNPAHPDGTIRAPHPVELFGDDWLDWSLDRQPAPADKQDET